jgi:MFS family permease
MRRPRRGAPEPRRAGGGILRRHPAFRDFWIARTLSLLGDGIAFTALLLYVEATERRGVAVGGLLLAQSLPRLLGPIAGTLADRLDQRRLMMACDLGQAVLFGLIAALLPSYPVLLTMAAAASALTAVFVPAGRSAVPSLVGHDDLVTANAWLGTALNLRVVFGSFLGGALVAGTGVRGALTANALSFVLSAMFIARVPQLPPEPTEDARPGLLTGTAAGLSFAARHAVARAVTIGLFVGVTFAAMDNVALVFLARRDFGTGALGFGMLGSAFGVGMVIGSVALIRIGERLAPARMFVLGMAANGFGTLLTGLAPALGAAVAFQGAAGAGNGLQNVASDTIIQRSVPRPMLGRVFGTVATASVLGGSLASAAGAVLLDLTSPRIVFVVSGLGVAAVILALLPMFPKELLGRSPPAVKR